MSKFRQYLAIGFVLSLPVLSGCFLFPDQPNEIAISASDNGSEITIQVNDILVITLEANPSTGYSWERVNAPAPSILEIVEVPKYAGSSELPGAGGTMTFKYQALSAGSETLTLVYHRPWEEGVDPAETFDLRVVVE